MHVMELAWDDIRTVMLVVRHGSLAAAANALGVNYTTVSRHIRRAEAVSGQRLFERVPEGYRPTDAARLIAAHAVEMEQSERGLLRKLQGQSEDISGPMTITAPQLLIAYFLAPVIAEFTKTYPKVDLRVLATNEILDLTRLEADMAIRISRDPGDTLTGLRLLEQHTASFAHKDLAARIADDPEMMIDWIIYDAYNKIPNEADPAYPNQRVHLRFDDMIAMVGAARSGLGVVRTTMFVGRNMPDLVQVPVLPPQPYADIWAVGHPDVWPSAKLKAFRTILQRHCKDARALFKA